MKEKIKEYIHENITLILLFVLLAGLSIGAIWQASSDITVINNILNESASKGIVISDGHNYYVVSTYVFPESIDYKNITYIYENKTYNIDGEVK